MRAKQIKAVQRSPNSSIFDYQMALVGVFFKVLLNNQVKLQYLLNFDQERKYN